MEKPKNSLRTRTVFVFRSIKNHGGKPETNPTDATTVTYTTTATGSGMIFP